MALRGGKGDTIKAKDLYDKTQAELSQLEQDLRSELMSLRVAQQVGGQPGRVNKIKTVRKNIARVLTVMVAQDRKQRHKDNAGKKHKPKDIRQNRHWPKAWRTRLTRAELSIKSERAKKFLKLKVWGAGVRPMRRLLVADPLPPPTVGVVDLGIERTFEQYPRHRKGAKGRHTATGHIPEHAKGAMAKKKAHWIEERKRLKALQEKKRERMEE